MNIYKFLKIDGITLFNYALRRTINCNRNFIKNHAGYYEYYKDLKKHLLTQEQKRIENRKKNLIVPPMIVLSVTNNCNLKCKGCYANAQCRNKEEEMSISEIDRIIGESENLGTSVIMLVGGEPLMKEGILDVIKKYNKMIFVMFTNGTMITEKTIECIKPLKNLIITFSLEGDRVRTDWRRGEGIFDSVISSMKLLNKEDILFGTSITVTRQNFGEVTSDEYVSMLEENGLGIIFYIEYVPGNDDTEMCLSKEQKNTMFGISRKLDKRHNVFTIPMVGYQRYFGGCIAAGRGLVHISSTGTMEACPFSPYSDTNVKNMSLEKALKSKFIAYVRKNHQKLQGANGGCTLSENKGWAEKVLRKCMENKKLSQKQGM